MTLLPYEFVRDRDRRHARDRGDRRRRRGSVHRPIRDPGRHNPGSQQQSGKNDDLTHDPTPPLKCGSNQATATTNNILTARRFWAPW